MPIRTGTHDINDLLATRFQSVAEFGMDTIQAVLAAELVAHNRIVDELLMEFTAPTTDRQRIYGTSIAAQMTEVDEYGRSATRKQRPGATVGFPLRRYQHAVGWTELWMQIKTPADMAIAFQQGERAHLAALRRETRRAFYVSSNYTFRDFLVDNVDLAVKALVNADGQPIPPGPNGEEFDGATHTHYLATTPLDDASVQALVRTVVEHGFGQQLRIAIALADESAWRGLTEFKPYIDVRLTHNANQNEPMERLDTTKVDDRAIGLIEGAEVWIKPWAIEDYAVCWSAGSPERPLAYRRRPQVPLQGLRIAAQLNTHPLHAEFMEADFGLGAWNRTAAAVLYYGGGVYVDPEIN